MKNYEAICNKYLGEYERFKHLVEEPPFRWDKISEITPCLKKAPFTIAIGYCLKHDIIINESGEAFRNYFAQKYQNRNWWYGYAAKYVGRYCSNDYQKLHDAAVALRAMGPEYEIMSNGLIEAIERDIAKEVLAKHPELVLQFPQEKQYNNKDIMANKEMAGEMVGWNICTDAISNAYNTSEMVNHIIYSAHEVAMEASGYGFFGVRDGFEEMQKEYETYQWAVKEGRLKETSFGGCLKYTYVPKPDAAPECPNYEDVLKEQIENSELRSAFDRLIKNIEKPELNQMQKDAIKRFKTMTERPEQER